MHRFGKYIVTALITFTLGLVFSFLTGGHWFSSKHAQTIQPALSVDGEDLPRLRRGRWEIPALTRSPDRVLSTVAHGVTSDGFETQFFEYQYADGTFVNQLSVFYRSPERATAELQKRLEQASEVIRRERILDERGRPIGEKVVATFPRPTESASAELLSTEYSRFVIVKRSSLKDILADFEAKR